MVFSLVRIYKLVINQFLQDVSTNQPGLIKFQAQSPDELAMVEGAARMGFLFLSRSSKSLTIKPYDYSKPQIWDTILEFPFDSKRKRMTVIVKPPQLDIYIMMTKGADNEMLSRLGASNPDIVKTAGEHSNSFARQGLRTLVLAQRILTGEEIANIDEQLSRARSGKEGDSAEALNRLYDRFENNLELVGCIALEDRLQDEVPETIACLLEAGIKLWVLTGDKLVSKNNRL